MTAAHLEFLPSSARLHHIGLAVRDISKAGLGELTPTADPTQRVRVAFVTIGDSCIELIEPLDGESPINNSLEKGTKLVHLCYEVDDLEAGIAQAEQHRFKTIHLPTPAMAFDGRRIAWIYHPLWGLIELLEREKR